MRHQARTSSARAASGLQPRNAVIALLLTGCQAVWGFEEFDAGGSGATSAAASAGSAAAGSAGTAGVGGGGSAGSAGAAGSGATTAGSGGAPSCSNPEAPSAMTGVRLATGQCVWIDDREVTIAEYGALLSHLDQVGDNAAFTDVPCQWKTGFDPGCTTDAGSAATDTTLPVTCVDWCDARAYCRLKGKRLCGEPGARESWWQTACASGGAQYEYPYGPSYDAQACNGRDNIGHGCLSSCMLAPTGSQASCKTPSGIYDLSGNVSEWADECAGYSNAAEPCAIRGGSVAQDASALLCKSSQTPPRSTRAQFVGFRCCWVPG
jgi:formylglycine-generating enzyme